MCRGGVYRDDEEIVEDDGGHAVSRRTTRILHIAPPCVDVPLRVCGHSTCSRM